MENMKTIAVIESCDTKFKEAKFISDFIKNEGLNALVINTATGPAPSYNYDISREEIAESYGTPWEEMEPKSKGEKIDYMKDAVAAYVVKLYEEGKIDGKFLSEDFRTQSWRQMQCRNCRLVFQKLWLQL